MFRVATWNIENAFDTLHDDGKDDQIPEAAPLVADDTGDDHEHAAAESQDGHHEALETVELTALDDEHDEHGDIHGVEGDDGQLGRIEAELAEVQAQMKKYMEELGL